MFFKIKFIGIILFVTLISSCSKTIYFYESNYGEKIYLIQAKKKFYRHKQNFYHVQVSDFNADSNRFDYQIIENQSMKSSKTDYFEYEVIGNEILYKKGDQKQPVKLTLIKDSIQKVRSLPFKVDFLKIGLIYSNSESLRHYHTNFNFYVKYIGDSIHMLHSSSPLKVYKFEYYYSLNDNIKDVRNPIIISFDSRSGVPVYFEYKLKSINNVLLQGTTNCIDIVKLRIPNRKLNKLLVNWNI